MGQHVPDEQVWLPVHAFVQLPQCVREVRRSKHPSPQHVAPAPHTVPHARQWVTSLGTHALSQQRSPASHASQPPQCASSLATHAPAQHSCPASHARPHAPQFAGSE